MGDKYLVLEFQNAGWFNDNRKSKDKCFDNINGHTDRKNIGGFTEPINIHHISNMLHVLFGERPVPMHRYSIANKLDKYIDMANNSYIKIDTFNDSGNKMYHKEKMRMKKAMHNANSSPQINWYIIREYIGKELFDEFVLLLNEKYGISNDTHSLIDTLDIVRKTPEYISDFKLKLESSKKTALSRFIQNKDVCTIGQDLNPRVKHTYANGIDNIIRLKGTIIVPVNDDDLIKLSKCVGIATLLDGGLVNIKNVAYSYSLHNIDDYIKISDISLEINENSYFKIK
jgi:hypothetical protein